VPELEEVRYHAADRPDIIVMDGYLDAVRYRDDRAQRLHRLAAPRGGYGLNLIDAMVVGTPVVATGYSGNLAFMDSKNSFLVRTTSSRSERQRPYEPHAHWAQPRIDDAAALLRAVHDDPPARCDVERPAGRASCHGSASRRWRLSCGRC